jgi:hypothetical protein
MFAAIYLAPGEAVREKGCAEPVSLGRLKRDKAIIEDSGVVLTSGSAV